MLDAVDDTRFRILSLDGGGAKGFYTLGVLREVEALAGRRLCEVFDLIFGTSTGAIISALLSLGYRVDEILQAYRSHVVAIMSARGRAAKSQALAELGDQVFGQRRFDECLTGVGIVATKWIIERPMIFKASVAQAHGRISTFVPGFGCTISDAVQASCSAYPFFNRKTVTTATGETIELADGGYCANNPSLYAMADATKALGIEPDKLRVLSVGVGEYPAKTPRLADPMFWLGKFEESKIVQKTFDINTQSMEQLRHVLFKDVQTIRINDAYTQPDMATDMFENDMAKLSVLTQRGAESFAARENIIRKLIL